MEDLLEEMIEYVEFHIGSTYSDTTDWDDDFLAKLKRFRDNGNDLNENQILGQSTII